MTPERAAILYAQRYDADQRRLAAERRAQASRPAPRPAIY